VRSDLRVVEICAGAGGQSLGLEQAGFNHLAAVEIDEMACATLTLNRPDWPVIRGDITDCRKFDPSSYEGADLLAGGVPCPPFSVAGKQLGADDERDLYAFAIDLFARIQPSALLLENVRGLASPRFAGYRARVLEIVRKLGYWGEWRLLQASDFGVPQLRPRLVFIALKNDFAPYFSWPQEDSTNTPNVGETLYSLMALDGWHGADAWKRRAATIAPTIVGGSKKHGGPDLGPTRAKKAWLKLGVDAKGIADGSPGRDLPSNHIPRLTNEMVALIQGWKESDGWQFVGGKTAQYRQIGNAFPPPVAKALGHSIRGALLKNGEKRPLPVAELTDASVYLILAEAKNAFVPMNALSTSTGLRGDQVDIALRYLEGDFLIERKVLEGEPHFRLGGFKGSIPEVSQTPVQVEMVAT
jgi:DNA (cytosine-5)-methyltransferase 1